MVFHNRQTVKYCCPGFQSCLCPEHPGGKQNGPIRDDVRHDALALQVVAKLQSHLRVFAWGDLGAPNRAGPIPKLLRTLRTVKCLKSMSVPMGSSLFGTLTLPLPLPLPTRPPSHPHTLQFGGTLLIHGTRLKQCPLALPCIFTPPHSTSTPTPTRPHPSGKEAHRPIQFVCKTV